MRLRTIAHLHTLNCAHISASTAKDSWSSSTAPHSTATNRMAPISRATRSDTELRKFTRFSPAADVDAERRDQSVSPLYMVSRRLAMEVYTGPNVSFILPTPSDVMEQSIVSLNLATRVAQACGERSINRPQGSSQLELPILVSPCALLYIGNCHYGRTVRRNEYKRDLTCDLITASKKLLSIFGIFRRRVAVRTEATRSQHQWHHVFLDCLLLEFCVQSCKNSTTFTIKSYFFLHL